VFGPIGRTRWPGFGEPLCKIFGTGLAELEWDSLSSIAILLTGSQIAFPTGCGLITEGNA